MIPFKDLNLNSAFLFAAALSDPETCKIVLEIILGREVGKVDVKTENSIMLSSDARCIRLDVNAMDGFEVNYDIVAFLKPGEDFAKLPESFVIFICTFDPFGRGLYRYTYIERCEENGEPLRDGTYKIFINTKGENPEAISEELRNFLGYFEDSTDNYVSGVNSESIKKLHERVKTLKKSRDWESGYMKMEEMLSKREKAGMEAGRREGVAEGTRKERQRTVLDFLEDLGTVSKALIERIENEENEDILKSWVKLAAKVNSIEEFQEQM